MCFSESCIKTCNSRLPFVQIHLAGDGFPFGFRLRRLEQVGVPFVELHDRHFALTGQDVADHVPDLKRLDVQHECFVLEVCIPLFLLSLHALDGRFEHVIDFSIGKVPKKSRAVPSL